MAAPVEVTLGEHTVPVYAQRHAYLINRLGRFISDLQEQAGDLEADQLLAWLQGRSYELLCALIPVMEKRIPEYEFRGYSSREAMDAGDYDPEADRSPTMPEIRHALTEASRVNGFDVLLHLKALVDPKLARRWVTAQLAEQISPELAELALREWGLGLDEFWDDSANLDRERGLTIPRLRELVEAYERRYHRQLRDVGVATALAQHDPKGLDRLLPPTGPKPGGDAGEKWWDS